MNIPSWCEALYPNQEDAIHTILTQLSESDIVFLDAPTGSGKTLIAYMVAQNFPRAIYLCTTLSLQLQFMSDYPTAALLQGRANYPTLTPSPLINCADCNKKKVNDAYICLYCNPVSDCPYEKAKTNALRNRLVCSNTQYFLHEANYVGTTRGRFVIIDECDILEELIMSFIQVHISSATIKALSLTTPTKRTVQASWLDWLGRTKPYVASLYRRESNNLPPFPQAGQLRRYKRLERLYNDLTRLDNCQLEGWVYTGYNEGDIIFKPINVAPFANQYLWRWGTKFLCMSGTIISADELANSLGIVE